MILVIGILAALLLNGSNAFAADPSLMRVVVVPSAGQMSLVVEMSDEARSVSTQQASATVLVVEAGPIAPPVKRQILNAPSGLSLLDQVAIDEGTTDGNERVLRLRVSMKRSAPSTVRVVGRRIYIDFMMTDVSMPSAATPPPIPAGSVEQTRGRVVPQGNRPAPDAPYREAVTGAASRFEQIQPFLISATTAASPNPTVLNAVAAAITELQESLHAVKAPPGGTAQLQLLVSAVSLAAESVSAGFQGDRASKAKQSLAVFAAAKAQLQ